MNNYIILIILLFIIIFNNIVYVCFFNTRQEGFNFNKIIKKVEKAVLKPIKPILDFLKNTGVIVENFVVDLLKSMFGKDKFSKYIRDRIETTRGTGTWGFAAFGMLIAATLFAIFILVSFYYFIVNVFVFVLINGPIMIFNLISYIVKSLIATPVIEGINIVQNKSISNPSMKDSDISKGMSSLESIKQSGLI